jgi:prepilin-type N-terminal cleavage/methylation domain-containing protein
MMLNNKTKIHNEDKSSPILDRATFSSSPAFTIVELLVVIVVIGILAAITVVSYTGVQAKAQTSKMNEDLVNLSQAIQLARITSQKTLMNITGSGYTASGCVSQPAGTDLAALPKTDTCWSRYLASLSAISTSSGVNVSNMIDPWGRPYRIDENEGESGGCGKDSIGVYDRPFTDSTYPGVGLSIPLSGYSGCS